MTQPQNTPTNPAPEAVTPLPEPSNEAVKNGDSYQPKPEPTRYGDWEKNGRCIDF